MWPIPAVDEVPQDPVKHCPNLGAVPMGCYWLAVICDLERLNWVVVAIAEGSSKGVLDTALHRSQLLE